MSCVPSCKTPKAASGSALGRSGVYRFENRELTLFSEDEGLVDNQVRTVLEDQRGRIWFETAKGNNRFDAGVISTFSDREYLSRNNWRIEPGDLC